MTNNVVVIVSCGTDNPNRATRAIHLATVAQSEGKNVSVFFVDEGVFLLRKGMIDNLRATTGDIADDLMAHLEAFEVPLLACGPCAKARMIDENNLIEGARLAPAKELIHLIADAAVISL